MRISVLLHFQVQTTLETQWESWKNKRLVNMPPERKEDGDGGRERCAQIRLVGGVHISTCDGQREVFTSPLWNNKTTKERMVLHS